MISTIKKTMQKIMGTPVHVFIMAAIIAGTIFLLLLDNYKQYQTEISIIIIPKSVAITDHKAVVHNVKIFPTTLMFYDRLLADNASLEDVAMGKTSEQRRNAWNRKISTDILENGKSSIMILKLYGNTAEQSRDLAIKSAQTLFAVTSKFYNLKDDVNLQVIDQPTTEPSTVFVYIFAVVSFVLGFILAWLVEKLFVGIELKFKKQASPRVSIIRDQIRNLKQSIVRADIKISRIEDIYKEEEHVDVKDFEKEKEESHRADKLKTARLKSMYPNFPEMPVHQQKASAPSNLPVAEDMDEAVEEITEEEKQQDINHMKDHEPTEEEIKMRLNKLLRGDM